MLTQPDIQKINTTRILLQRLAAYDAGAYDGAEFGGGKFDEACEQAERALFNVLVIAYSFLGVEISNEDLQLQGEQR